jgi:hypothetical protein
MTRKLAAALLGLGFVTPFVRGDTLTLRSAEEINGKVQYENDAFTIVARYHGGDRTITFDRREVLTLEINSRDFNPGEPPKNITILKAGPPATRDASGPGEQHRESGRPVKADAHDKAAGTRTQSVQASDDFDRATTDVVWMRNQTKVLGRLLAIKNGRVRLKTDRDNKEKELDAEGVATLLIAPN